MLRCLQIGLTIRDLDLVTVGMITDMYAESTNDECNDAYVQTATQADFDTF